ncbi:MAG: class I SAM-dependent methyltransferase, partial [Chloroflexota bacterium]|nr:class I SAM-dependent methyltransferase [Chloroflexota bacterium]
RMDVTLTPYVDIVADAHALPFLPGTLDFIFSQAVVEHLRQPFVAVREMYRALKDGGYVYHECNFVFAYHGYPHHYFNATLQGMEQIFAQYTPLRAGVAPYQMPSFALQMVIATYLRHSQGRGFTHGRHLVQLLEQVLNQPLMSHDIYFTEQAAQNVAAGTYFFGVKQTTPDATIIPSVIKTAWVNNPELRRRYPNLPNLGTIDNLLIWAQTEGWKTFAEIETYLSHLERFDKRGDDKTLWDRSTIRSLPLIEPRFGAIGFNPDDPLEVQSQRAESQTQPPVSSHSVFAKGVAILRNSGFRQFGVATMRYLVRQVRRIGTS